MPEFKKNPDADEILSTGIKDAFDKIETLLDLLSDNYGLQSPEIEMAQDHLNEGDIEAAYYSLASTVHFEDLIREIHKVRKQIEATPPKFTKISSTSNKPILN